MISAVSELYEMDDAAFNRAVAELAGWRVVLPDASLNLDPCVWMLYFGNDPRGYVYGENADDAWREAVAGGLMQQWGDDLPHSEQLPDYANDLNAAWALMPIQYCVSVAHRAETPMCVATIWREGSRLGFSGESLSPARALATAYAAYRWHRLLPQAGA